MWIANFGSLWKFWRHAKLNDNNSVTACSRHLKFDTLIDWCIVYNCVTHKWGVTSDCCPLFGSEVKNTGAFCDLVFICCFCSLPVLLTIYHFTIFFCEWPLDYLICLLVPRSTWLPKMLLMILMKFDERVGLWLDFGGDLHYRSPW